MTFKKNYIYEVILKIDTGNEKNFAPIGIKYLGTENNVKKFEISVFKKTKTACLLSENSNKNLNRKRNFELTCIFASDLDCFYNSITKNFSSEFIRKIEKFPKAVLEPKEIDALGDKFRITCTLRPTEKSAERKIEKNLLNRAKYLALEALVCYTKPMVYDEKIKKISEMLRVIKKVAPDSEYERIVSDLLINIKGNNIEKDKFINL